MNKIRENMFFSQKFVVDIGVSTGSVNASI